MAPAIKGTAAAAVASANNVANPTTLTPTLPTHESGDLLLCFTVCRSQTPTVATPSGWTQLANVTGSNGRIALFGKTAASASESAPSVVWSGMTTGTSGNPAMAQCAVFTDTQLVTDVVGTAENGAASTTAAASGTSITTLTADDLVLSLSCRVDDVGTWTSPSGFTEIAEALTTSGADMSCSWAYQVKSTAGSVAPADFALSGATSGASVGVLVALKAVVVTPPAFPTYGVADNFNRADAQPPSGNWTGSFASNGWQVKSNQFTNASGGWDGIVWNRAPASADQEIYVTIAAKGADTKQLQLWVRRDGATDSGYYAFIQPAAAATDQVFIWKRVSGSDTQLGAIETPAEWAAGDSFGLSVVGSRIWVWRKPSGGSWAAITYRDDTSITAASSGVAIFSNDAGWILDDFGGPSLATEYFGAAAMALSLSTASQGTRSTFGQAAMNLNLPTASQATRTTYGTGAAPLTLLTASQGVRGALSAAQLPLTLDLAANAGTPGVTVAAGQVISGQPLRAGAGWRAGQIVPRVGSYVGAATLDLGISTAAQGVRQTFGQTNLPLGLALATQGSRSTFGTAVLQLALATAAQGSRATFGQAALAMDLGTATQARLNALSAAQLQVLIALAAQGNTTAGGFTPDQISGLSAWLDASQLALSADAPVLTWPDLSPGGNDLSQMFSGAPTFKTNVLNGLPVVRFSGDSQTLHMSGNVAMGHWFAVAHFRTATFPTYNGLLTGPGGNDLYLIGNSGTTDFYHHAIATYEYRLDGTTYPPNWPAPMGGTFGNMNLSRDLIANCPLQVGQDRDQTSRWWDGDVAEIVVYDHVLTSAERQQVEDYLDAKWFAPPVPQERFGAALWNVLLALSAQGTRETMSLTTLQLTLAFAVQGLKETMGQAALNLALAIAAQGNVQRVSSGEIALNINLAAAGIAGVRGQAVVTLNLSLAAAAVRATFGQAAMPLAFQLAADSTVMTPKLGAAVLAMSIALAASGIKYTPVQHLGAAVLPLTLAIFAEQRQVILIPPTEDGGVLVPVGPDDSLPLDPITSRDLVGITAAGEDSGAILIPVGPEDSDPLTPAGKDIL